MKHGLILLALTCWVSGALFALDSGIPASPGMLSGVRALLTFEEMLDIDGGDVLLSVDRDKQMMTVTRITPGNYDNIQSYSVKVTTSVVQNKELGADNPKGAMENSVRKLTTANSSLVPINESRTPTQFPTGTASISPTIGTQPLVQGPVIRTNATQDVKVTGNADGATLVKDTGYNIHYVDPAKATNTLGCIGVQSMSGMEKVVQTVKTDLASNPSSAPPKQTVSVSAYTNNTPPPNSTFRAVETNPVSVVAPAPAPKPAAAAVAAAPSSWWKFW